jgi:hypothetical protein
VIETQSISIAAHENDPLMTVSKEATEEPGEVKPGLVRDQDHRLEPRVRLAMSARSSSFSYQGKRGFPEKLSQPSLIFSDRAFQTRGPTRLFRRESDLSMFSASGPARTVALGRPSRGALSG